MPERRCQKGHLIAGHNAIRVRRGAGKVTTECRECRTLRKRRLRNRAALARAASGELRTHVHGQSHPWRRPYKNLPDASRQGDLA